MISRTIGGIGFVVIFYLCLFMDKLFLLLLLTFLIAGLIELKNIFNLTNKKKLTVLYGVVFVAFILSMMYLSRVAIPFLIYITVVLMLDDTFAYFVGKSIGKHKLSKISPNKTIEGSLGGLILSPFVSVGLLTLLGSLLANYSTKFIIFDISTIGDFNPFVSMSILVLLSFVMALLGQCGDLVESYFKRSSGIKDSGKFVYGHGGILDRIDSWIFPIILMTIIFILK